MFLKVSRNIDLVYGGGSIGLMGLVSQAVHDGGRHVIGWALLLVLINPSILTSKVSNQQLKKSLISTNKIN